MMIVVHNFFVKIGCTEAIFLFKSQVQTPTPSNFGLQ